MAQPDQLANRPAFLPEASPARAEAQVAYRGGRHHPALARMRCQWLQWTLVMQAWASRVFKRSLDIVGASLGLALTAPLSALVVAWHAAGGRQILVRSPAVGRHRARLDLLAFDRLPGALGRLAARWGLLELPVLLNVLHGDLSLVGPRPRRIGEPEPSSALAIRRLAVRPGLLCLWWIRQRGNTDYEGEAEADREYVEARSLGLDLGLLLRGLLVTVYGAPVSNPPGSVEILGIRVANLSLDAAVGAIVGRLSAPVPSHVAFLNAHNANVACTDPDYRDALERCDLVLPDGIGVKLAGSLLHRPIRQNVNGTDLFPRLCQALEGREGRVFLLGGRPEVVEAVAGWMAAHHPTLTVCGHHHGHFPPSEDGAVAAEIAQARASLLVVGMGTPRQEAWIRAHLEATGARVAIGVGGLFDFISERVPRAPRFLRDVGLEWAWRLLKEPARLWRRYLVGNPVFLARVLIQRLSLRDGRPWVFH